MGQLGVVDRKDDANGRPESKSFDPLERSIAIVSEPFAVLCPKPVGKTVVTTARVNTQKPRQSSIDGQNVLVFDWSVAAVQGL